jgi:hypothetical protein
MPSFDIVNEIDKHELVNAVDQANREIGHRFDLKATGAKFELEQMLITAQAPGEFQLKQINDILRQRLAARRIDLRCLDPGTPEINVAGAKQKIKIKQGIEQAQAKKIVAKIKESKLKVEAQINGDKLRISGKKKDDLQMVMALLDKAELEIPVQYENFRD